MVGTVHLVWFDPDNTVANVPSAPPANTGHGIRDNAASLVAAGGGLPGFSLDFTTEGPSPNSHWMKKAYLAIEDARYGDNFIVAVHPHSGIAETFEFRENESQELVLMRPANTGLWTPLPDDNDPNDDPADGVQDHRTSVLTIIPSVDIDTDSDNTGTINRSDHEEEVENQANEPGKIVLLNNDDDNGNNQSDMDEVDASGNPLVYSQPDDDLTQVILDFGLVSYDGLDGCALRLTASDGLRIWGDQLRNLPDGATVQGTGYNQYEWMIPAGTTSDPFPGSVYVEGIATGRQWVTWELSGSSGQVLASDTVVFTVIDFGLASVDLEATDAARKHDITRDTGDVYDDVEWVDPSPDGTLQGAPDDHRLPVCYTRSGPHGDVHVRVEQVDIRLLGNLGVTSVMVRANGTIGGQTITLPETAATISGDQIVAMNLDSPEAIPDVIRHTEIVLNWQVSLDGGPWLDVGTSLNTAYITWDDPLLAASFETCLFIGCQAADNHGGADGTDDITTIQAVWSNGFTSRTVTRVGGTELHYYSPWNTNVTDTAGLLSSGNGQCGAWAKLFIDVLKAQGLYTNYSATPSLADDYVIVTPAPGYADGFIVNSWRFAVGGGHSGLSDFPYLNIPNSPFMVGDSYVWLYAEVTDQMGVAGQNSSNPCSLFNNHEVVRIVHRDRSGTEVETFYDPSYGVTYRNMDDMEATSVSGYFRDGMLGVSETTVGLDLDHDGHISNTLVDVYVLVFRTNDLGGHLVGSYFTY